MKRYLSVLLALPMLLGSLAACTPEQQPQDQPTEQETEAMTEEQTTLEEIESEPEDQTQETVPDTGYPIDLMTIGEVPFASFSLYVQPNAPKGITDAVEMLIEYAEKATGHKLVINEDAPAEHAIVIGKTDYDTDALKAAREQVENDGYAFLEENGKVYITGNCTAGTVYGVYTFMENYFGVRFYTEDYTYVRDNPIVRIPAGYSEIYSPALIMRDSFWYDLSQSRPLANRLKDNSEYNPDLEGGISYAGSFVHTLAALTNTKHEIGKQPCLTDEKVYQTVLANVRAWLRSHPNANIISVSQNDSAAEHLGCQCANCKAIDEREGTPMGSLLTFVNRIANDIKDEYPNVYVDTLAYRYTRQAPKTIKPADNVIIRLCSIECCFTHALSEACIYNTSFRKDIEAWSAICDNLYIWDYTYNAETYFTFFPNFDVLCDNVKFYKEHNVKGVFLEGQQVSVSGEFAELRSYLLAKLLWDPDMTEDEYYAHMDEFMQYYYGPGWVKIKEYMQAMTAHAIARNTHVGIFDKGLKMYPFTKENGKRDLNFGNNMKAYWDEAMEMAQTEEQRAHVEKSSIQAYYLCSLDGKSSERKANLKKVYELCEKYGIEYYKYVIPMPDASHSDDLNSLL